MPEFPASWKEFPVDVRRYLAARLIEKALEIHEGPAGLIKFLYAGTDLKDVKRSQTYGMTGRDFWPFVIADTEAWLAARAAKTTPPTQG